MIFLSTLFILIPSFYYVTSVYVEAMVGNSVAATGFKPQVAMRCGYYNQYYDRTGVWLSDSRGNCLTEPKDILEYCRSVYPDLNITNVMESGTVTQVENWCQPNEVKCDMTFSVAPFRCLEGSFQSEALLVPEGCIFDHVHNGKSCLTPEYWAKKAEQACHNRGGVSVKSRMTVRSSSMLLPCRVGQFSGVEFVCCPPQEEKAQITTTPVQLKAILSQTTYKESQIDQSTPGQTTNATTKGPGPGPTTALPDITGSTPGNHVEKLATTTTTTWSTDVGTKLKAYLDGFDKSHEHEAFVQAKKSLRDKRRQNIVRIMEEWGMSEHRYQKLKETDPLAAEQFKRDITNRFQKTITALEEEETAQKKQLIAVHEQRVTSLLNEKKREYMFDFLRELERTHPSANEVRETLQKLLRTEEKDKMHVIHYYEHLLNTDPLAASKVKSMVAQHVSEIEHRMNRSVKMLSKRLPTIYHLIYPQIKTYLQSIKSRNGDFEELTRSITNAERPALDTTFRVQASPETRLPTPLADGVSTAGPNATTAQDGDEDYDDDDPDDDDVSDDDDDVSDDEDDVDDDVTTTRAAPDPRLAAPVVSQFLPDAGRQKSPNFASRHLSPYAKRGDNQLHFLETPNMQEEHVLKSESSKTSSGQSVVVASIVSSVVVASFALIIVGLVLVRRKMHFNHPHNQHQPLPTHPGRKGEDNISNFVEVDNQSLEERHLANMQVNGYENPTYRYFEKIAPKA